MKLVDIEQKDDRIARAWYVMYPNDAYALGPYRYNSLVPASRAVEDAECGFGEKPRDVWPEGEIEDVDEYSYTVSVPEEDRGMYE